MSTGTHETTWSGAIVQTEGDVAWSLFGTLVVLNIPEVIGDDSTGDYILMDTALPANLRPSSTQVLGINGVEDGQDILLKLTIPSDGNASAAPASGSPFSGTGQHGIKASVVYYFL